MCLIFNGLNNYSGVIIPFFVGQIDAIYAFWDEMCQFMGRKDAYAGETRRFRDGTG